MSIEMVCLNQEEVIERQQRMIRNLLQEVAQFREVTKEEAKYIKTSDSWDSVSK